MAKAKTKTTTKKSTKANTKPIVAEPAVTEAVVAETASTDRSYNFNILCKSGETKAVTIVASSLQDARQQLREFADKN